MAIQFNCPKCGHLLQTPDGTEGKKARCPSCSEIVEVPAVRAGSSLPDDGFGMSEPVSKNPPFEPAAKEEFNPFAAPSASSAFADRPDYSSVERTGPPWENPGPSTGTFVETVKRVIMTPTDTFRTMVRTGGLGRPLMFTLAAQMIGSVFAILWNVLVQGGMMMMGGGANAEVGAAGMAFGLGFGLLVALIAAPIGVIIFAFVWSGVVHLFLMLFRAANLPYEVTFRTVCYGTGGWAVLNIVPCLGPYVAGIGGLVATIIGLIHTQETTTGKAVAACLAPVAVCCILYIGIVALVVIIGVGANQM